jgi:flagellar basal-body rod protein FlgC
MDAISIASSGLRASMARLTASASNVANADTVGATSPSANQPAAYQPVRAISSETAAGGVTTSIRPVEPGTTLRYEPSATQADAQGMVAAPNVDVTDEMVEQLAASESFKANLALIRTVSDLQRETFERWG